MKTILLAAAAAFLCAAPALAQQGAPPGGPYNDTHCGSWVNDTWVPNGNCTSVTVIRHGTITGTITGVNGHLVTVQQSTRSIVINDQPALTRQQTGRVAKGRQIVAYGYWQGGTFYATAIY